MKKPNIKTAFNKTMRKNSEIISGYCAKDIPSERQRKYSEENHIRQRRSVRNNSRRTIRIPGYQFAKAAE